MFCAAITFLQYFKDIKPGGGCFAPPLMSLGGQTAPLRQILKVLPKRYLRTKHVYLILGCIAYCTYLTEG